MKDKETDEEGQLPHAMGIYPVQYMIIKSTHCLIAIKL